MDLDEPEVAAEAEAAPGFDRVNRRRAAALPDLDLQAGEPRFEIRPLRAGACPDCLTLGSSPR